MCTPIRVIGTLEEASFKHHIQTKKLYRCRHGHETLFWIKLGAPVQLHPLNMASRLKRVRLLIVLNAEPLSVIIL